ncbi:MAG TPA: galactose oxidase-like domain-containing protein [Phycisphaerae bacterium]
MNLNLKSVIFLVLMLSPFAALSRVSLAQECTGGTSVCGEWGPLVPIAVNTVLPGDPPDPTGGACMQPIHSIMLHTGLVLCVEHTPSSLRPGAVLVDPTSTSPNGSIRYAGVPNQPQPFPHDLFCSGHTKISDGRVIFRGGLGLPSWISTTVYDPSQVGNAAWIAGPDEQWFYGNAVKVVRRFYPTVTLVGDGRVLITEGIEGCGPSPSSPSLDDGNANVPVVLVPSSGAPSTWTWQPLYSAEYRLNLPPPNCLGGDCSGGANEFILGYYPTMFQLSDGSLFQAGFSDVVECYDPSPSQTRKLVIDPPGQAGWVSPLNSPVIGQCAVMYRKNTIMKGGGTHGAGIYSDDVTSIDLNAGTPGWTPLWADPPPPGALRPMNFSRTEFYFVALPSGGVMAVGGFYLDQQSGNFISVLAPEIYDPAQNTWNVMAPMAAERTYHASCVLLPSGAVFIAGGESPPGCTDQRKYQIYKPPYFFTDAQHPRPGIAACATTSSIHYGEDFTLTLTADEAALIKKVRLIRPGSATHSFDHDQRSMELYPTAVGARTLCVHAPDTGAEAPPGYYMLFVAKDLPGAPAEEGRLPSEAHWVHLSQGVPAGTSIVIANPPTANPYAPGAFVDVLQTGPYPGPNTLTQGIGSEGTPSEGPVAYGPITVKFSAPVTLTAADIGVNCSYTGTTPCATPCPKVKEVTGAGDQSEWQITLDPPIPAGACTRITFSSTLALEYKSLPGDVDMNGTPNTQDVLALINALNNGTANLPENLARYDIDRSGTVNTVDYSRLYQLLNGTSTTQPWSGVNVVPCITCGTEGGGGGGSAPQMGGGDSAAPGGGDAGSGLSLEQIAQIYISTQAACAVDGVGAALCLEILDSVFGSQP